MLETVETDYKKRANDRYKDHLGDQLTTKDVTVAIEDSS